MINEYFIIRTYMRVSLKYFVSRKKKKIGKIYRPPYEQALAHVIEYNI